MERSKSFRDVPITPYSELLMPHSGRSYHKGGPLWPDWNREVFARHKRGGRPVDDPPVVRDGPLPVVDRPLVWWGAVTHHFGHQVADFSSRLIAAAGAEGRPDFAFARLVTGGGPFPARVPRFFRGICDYFGLERERVRILDEPVRARTLTVFAQEEQISVVGPSPAYLDRLTDHAASRVPPRAGFERVYVSRAGMPTRFAGEAVLEEAFASAGFEVIRPETLPLMEQLAIYRAARVLVFARDFRQGMVAAAEADVAGWVAGARDRPAAGNAGFWGEVRDRLDRNGLAVPLPAA